MDAITVPKVYLHYPVLLKEIISVISPQHGGTFIDCTFGQGGYSKKILDFPQANVIALDRDKESEKVANEFKENFRNRFIFKNIKFSQLNNLKLKNQNIRGVIFDLGYSLTQIKDPKKALSFEAYGKLNMQLGLNSFSAEDVINKLDEKELEKIFKFFGDEKEGKYIARNIVKERLKNKIDTKSLVEIVDRSKRRKNFKVHNATKVFQALRIFVNKEISELIFGLINAAKVLKKDGVLGVVTFHSIEDKIVKYFFSNFSSNRSKPSRYFPENNKEDNFSLFDKYKNKVFKPSNREIIKNYSSRSAKLRYAIRSKSDFFYPKGLINKFKIYLDLESKNV